MSEAYFIITCCRCCHVLDGWLSADCQWGWQFISQT